MEANRVAHDGAGLDIYLKTTQEAIQVRPHSLIWDDRDKIEE